MQIPHGFLRKCDTGELNCFVCVGRENCKEYVHESDDLPSLKTCLICGKNFVPDYPIHPSLNPIDEPIYDTELSYPSDFNPTYLPNDTTPLPDDFSLSDFNGDICPTCKESYLNGMPISYWFETKSFTEFSIISPSYCELLTSEESDIARQNLYTSIATRINQILDKEANRFPFRSGYNLSVGFIRYKTSFIETFSRLHTNIADFTAILDIVHNFFINLPDDTNYTTETDDKVIFTQYGMRMAYYEDFLQRLSQYIVN